MKGINEQAIETLANIAIEERQTTGSCRAAQELLRGAIEQLGEPACRQALLMALERLLLAEFPGLIRKSPWAFDKALAQTLKFVSSAQFDWGKSAAGSFRFIFNLRLKDEARAAVGRSRLSVAAVSYEPAALSGMTEHAAMHIEVPEDECDRAQRELAEAVDATDGDVRAIREAIEAEWGIRLRRSNEIEKRVADRCVALGADFIAIAVALDPKRVGRLNGRPLAECKERAVTDPDPLVRQFFTARLAQASPLNLIEFARRHLDTPNSAEVDMVFPRMPRVAEIDRADADAASANARGEADSWLSRAAAAYESAIATFEVASERAIAEGDAHTVARIEADRVRANDAMRSVRARHARLVADAAALCASADELHEAITSARRCILAGIVALGDNARTDEELARAIKRADEAQATFVVDEAARVAHMDHSATHMRRLAHVRSAAEAYATLRRHAS